MFSLKEENGSYIVCHDGIVAKTPKGNEIKTQYKQLAERILQDLKLFGKDSQVNDSILPWYFRMVDFLGQLERGSVWQTLVETFIRHKYDWTCFGYRGDKWRKRFGTWEERKHMVDSWLNNMSIMQMSAVYHISRLYDDSLNLAFELAKIVEWIDTDNITQYLNDLAKLVDDNSEFGPIEIILKDFNNFAFFYAFDLRERGSLINKSLIDFEDSNRSQNEVEEFSINDLSDHTTTIEQLIGRNYYHYTDCIKDDEQPKDFEVLDFELDESYDEEDEDEEYEEDTKEKEQTGIEDYLPDNCWVKRFVDDNDSNTFYLLYLIINKEGVIQDTGIIEEKNYRLGGGMLFIPGMELPSIKEYSFAEYVPEKIKEDLKLLIKNRSLPISFSLIGKRLPQEMIEEGGNGGSNTNYTIALQSAFRLAYTHLSIDTNNNGIVESMEYSSYQSSGNAYGDMFSRPMFCSDRKDEAIDMLLYIYDKYSDEEIKK